MGAMWILSPTGIVNESKYHYSFTVPVQNGQRRHIQILLFEPFKMKCNIKLLNFILLYLAEYS